MLNVPDIVEKLVEVATNHQRKPIVKKSCSVLSIITAGNTDKIQMVFKNPDQIKSLMSLSQKPELAGGGNIVDIFECVTKGIITSNNCFV